MYDDDAGRTAALLGQMLQELDEMFGGRLFHIGCDETDTYKECTLANTASLEEKCARSLSARGKTLMGWEEFLFRTGAAQAVPGSIIEAWDNYRAKDVVAAGHPAVEAHTDKLYLNHLHPTYSQWFNVAAGVNASGAHLMLGAETCMWTPQYSNRTVKDAPGAEYFPPSTDALFARSFGGLVWPRAAVVAGATWNYIGGRFANVASTHENFAALLRQRGVESCPAGCKCDYTTACGKHY